MGETQHTLFPLDFNRSIVIEDRPERLTGDAGVLALRQIDQRLGLTNWLATQLTDPRHPDLITHPQVELLRTRLYLIAQGQRDGDDADRLGLDPAFRLAVSQRRGTAPLEAPDPQHPDGQPHALASQPTLSRLLRTLSSPHNRTVLRQGLLESAKRHLHAVRKQAARRGDDPRRLRRGTLDIDSYAVVVHGNQPGASYNGHYQTVCYHPLAAQFAPTGDWLDMTLREGQVYTAHDATTFLFDLLARVEAELCQVSDVRGDAGFPEETLLAGLEARRKPYVFRLKTNAVLERRIEPYAHRPPGRPPAEPRLWLYEFAYQAESWSRAPRRGGRARGARRTVRGVLLPGHELDTAAEGRRHAAGTLSPARHVRESPGRVPGRLRSGAVVQPARQAPLPRLRTRPALSVPRRVRLQRSLAAAARVGVQPGQRRPQGPGTQHPLRLDDPQLPRAPAPDAGPRAAACPPGGRGHQRHRRVLLASSGPLPGHAAASEQDAGQPSWQVLGALFRESLFVQAWRRAEFPGSALGVPVEDFLDEGLPLVGDHAYAAAIRAQAREVRQDRAKRDELPGAVRFSDVVPAMLPLIELMREQTGTIKQHGDAARR